eukprot:62774-Pleurochrysis_carterae.AAC.1
MCIRDRLGEALVIRGTTERRGVGVSALRRRVCKMRSVAPFEHVQWGLKTAAAKAAHACLRPRVARAADASREGARLLVIHSV